jgi:hypothetical protein
VSARATAIATAAALLAVAISSAWGAAPEAEKEARAHFQAGEARFKAGAFDEALAEYQKGYDVLPLPGFLVNVGTRDRLVVAARVRVDRAVGGVEAANPGA